MPGSSLWLIPPKEPFNRTLQTQISSMVPMRFYIPKPPSFIPHVTLTSGIDPALHEGDAQAWLDSLEFNLEALHAANEIREQETADSAAAEKRALEAGELPRPETTSAAAPPRTTPSDPEKAALEAGSLEPPPPQASVAPAYAPSDPEKAALESGTIEPPPTSAEPQSTPTTSGKASSASDPEKATLGSGTTEPPPTPAAGLNKAPPAPVQRQLPPPPPKASSTPPLPIEIKLHELEAGDAFFRKLALNATMPSPGLSALVTAVRAQACYNNDIGTAESWERDEYRPHLSLMYADVPRDDVDRRIPGIQQDLVRAKALLKPGRDGQVAKGGSIVLVPTDRDVKEWKPIASRPLADVVWKLNLL